MSTKIPKFNQFSKSREARELLAARALELLESYISLAAEAKDAGEFEVAADIYWKLIDHNPRQDGIGIVDSPASKPVEVSGPKGPQISIGVMLGGMKPKELEQSSVIDVLPLEVPKNEESVS